LLEYDDERSGSFEPLKDVPDDKIVVLGLVTTKTPRRETVEELAVRIREAQRYLPLERLALSPQRSENWKLLSKPPGRYGGDCSGFGPNEVSPLDSELHSRQH
jgi:hypothetical protein